MPFVGFYNMNGFIGEGMVLNPENHSRNTFMSKTNGRINHPEITNRIKPRTMLSFSVCIFILMHKQHRSTNRNSATSLNKL